MKEKLFEDVRAFMKLVIILLDENNSDRFKISYARHCVCRLETLIDEMESDLENEKK